MQSCKVDNKPSASKMSRYKTEFYKYSACQN